MRNRQSAAAVVGSRRFPLNSAGSVGQEPARAGLSILSQDPCHPPATHLSAFGQILFEFSHQRQSTGRAGNRPAEGATVTLSTHSSRFGGSAEDAATITHIAFARFESSDQSVGFPTTKTTIK